MTSIATITTIISSAYTIYYIHPFIPYRFVWTYMAVPTFNYIADTATGSKRRQEQEEIEKGLECYEIIKETRENGIVTRYLILKTENDYTIVNTEYDRNEPVWL